jgi:hypothetical protein
VAGFILAEYISQHALYEIPLKNKQFLTLAESVLKQSKNQVVQSKYLHKSSPF